MSNELDNGQVDSGQKTTFERQNSVCGVSLPAVIKERLWWKAELCGSARSTGARGCWPNVGLFILSNGLTGLRGDTHTDTHASISLHVLAIQLTVTLTGYSFVTVCCFAFSLRPPLVPSIPLFLIQPLSLSPCWFCPSPHPQAQTKRNAELQCVLLCVQFISIIFPSFLLAWLCRKMIHVAHITDCICRLDSKDTVCNGCP